MLKPAKMPRGKFEGSFSLKNKKRKKYLYKQHGFREPGKIISFCVEKFILAKDAYTKF